jgi:heat shock protein HtpX
MNVAGAIPHGYRSSPSLTMIEAQIGRNRWFTVLIAVVALASAAVVAFIVAGIVGSFVVGVLLIGLIAVFCVVVWTVFERIAPQRTGARPVTTAAAEQRLLSTVADLAPRFGVACPRVLVMDQPVPNAFAVGTGARAAVVCSTRLLELLDDEELAAVCAHELSHVANHDAKVAVFGASLLLWARLMLGLAVATAWFIVTIGKGFMHGTREDAGDPVGGILRLAFGAAFLVTATVVFVFGHAWFFVAKLADLGMCRQREWMADATAASVTENPLALASALEKLDRADTGLVRGAQLVQNLCLVGDSRRGQWWSDLFHTHPDTVRRIEQLHRFANPGNPRSVKPPADAPLTSPATPAAVSPPGAPHGATRRRRVMVGLAVAALSVAIAAVLAPWILRPADNDASSDTGGLGVHSAPQQEVPSVSAGRSAGSGIPASEMPPTAAAPAPAAPPRVPARTPAPTNSPEERPSPQTTTRTPQPAQQPPRIARVETYRDGVLVLLVLFFGDPDNDAEGFGFRGINGSGWAEEIHPFSSPSYGRVFPGRVEYPFNHGCGTASETESDVAAWIYDSTARSSAPIAVHLSCTAPVG